MNSSMINRRSVLALLASTLTAAPALSQQMSRPTAFGFSFTGIDGHSIRLANFAGKPILVVNTASQCGYTPQYTGLQELWTRYRSRGLVVVGVPSNDFGGQEPGGPSDTIRVAVEHFGVTFPLASKAVVNGPNAHPFYKWAALERPGETPRWNFHKFLVGREGHIVASFAQSIDPMDPRIIAAVERELPAV